MFFAHISGSGNESFVRINVATWEEAEKNLATYIGVRNDCSCNAEEVTLYQVSGSKSIDVESVYLNNEESTRLQKHLDEARKIEEKEKEDLARLLKKYGTPK